MALSLQRDWARTVDEIARAPKACVYVVAAGFNEGSANGFATLIGRTDIQVMTWDEVEANDYWHENRRPLLVSHDCRLNQGEKQFIAELNDLARQNTYAVGRRYGR